MTSTYRATVVVPLLIACTALCLPLSARQSAPANGQYRLTTLEVNGNRRYTQAEVLRVSGLKSGQTLTIANVDAAVQHLAKTGLFKSLNYHFLTDGPDLSVTLDIVESEWTVPVVFDNFVSMTDAELTGALRQEVPSFDGTAPADEAVTELIARALQNVLTARRLDGGVVLVPSVDLKTKTHQYVFKVEPATKVCALSIGGAIASADREFGDAARASVGKDYSRSYLTSLSTGTLLDIYHRRGFWRATFAEPTVSITQGACNGVAVSVPVNEGVSYAWDRAAWTGNTAMASDDLTRLLQMKPGSVANAAEIDAGLARVHDLYGRQGYILQSGAYSARPDDATTRVAFDFRIDEGAQFRMGTIDFTGVSEGDARTLQGQWRLEAGGIFDATYLNEFRSTDLTAFRRKMNPPRSADVELRLDQAQHLVNVRFVFR